MAELTIEMVAKVVKDEVGQLRGEMNDGFERVITQLRSEMNGGFAQIRREMTDGFGQIRSEMNDGFTQVRSEVADGFTQVLGAVDSIANAQDEEFEGIKGRLRSHSERIARLERHNNLR